MNNHCHHNLFITGGKSMVKRHYLALSQQWSWEQLPGPQSSAVMELAVCCVLNSVLKSIKGHPQCCGRYTCTTQICIRVSMLRHLLEHLPLQKKKRRKKKKSTTFSPLVLFFPPLGYVWDIVLRAPRLLNFQPKNNYRECCVCHSSPGLALNLLGMPICGHSQQTSSTALCSLWASTAIGSC